MNPEAFAVIAYGLMANVAALVIAYMSSSPLGAALVFVSLGATYCFQVLQIDRGDYFPVRLRALEVYLWLAAIASLVLSVAVSLWS